MPIVFDPGPHTYTNTDTGELYTSVTTVLGKYKKPFDKLFHAERVARRKGVEVQVVLDEWEQIKNDACAKGTKHHEEMEDLINTKGLMRQYVKTGVLPDGLESQLAYSFMEHISKIKDVEQIQSELMVYNHEHKIAGTGDVFVDTNRGFFIKDFKTNKRFRYHSYYGDFLLRPLQHLMECEFNIYALQLSMYALFYEQITGKRCLGLEIFYMKNGRWTIIPCNYMKYEVQLMLQHHSGMLK